MIEAFGAFLSFVLIGFGLIVGLGFLALVNKDARKLIDKYLISGDE